jgi:hypothetical protein
MGSQQQTTGSSNNTLNFNPIAQGIYNSLVGGGSSVLQGYMNNPLSNPTYRLGAAQAVKGAQQAGANNMGVLNQNQKVNGLTGNAGAGWLTSQRNQTGRANQSLVSNANIQNVQGAMNRQIGAAGTALSFNPQLTGSSGTSNQTTSTGGLGTWLPQLLSSGLGAGLGIAGMMGSSGGAGASPSGSSSSIMPSGFNSIGSVNPVSGLSSAGTGLGGYNPYQSAMFPQ